MGRIWGIGGLGDWINLLASADLNPADLERVKRLFPEYSKGNFTKPLNGHTQLKS